MKYYSLDNLNNRVGGVFQFDSIDDYLNVSSDLGFNEFLTHLKTPNSTIFIGWIEQWKEVKEILLKGETSISFSNYLKLEEHILFPSFKKFISPILYPIINKCVGENVLNETLEYIVLLEPDTRGVIEYDIYLRIDELFQKNHKLNEAKNVTEEQLINAVQDAVNEQNIKIINSFSKRSYAHVVSYVENCFQILESKGCTIRLANWIVKQLQLLKLNPEHLQQLARFKNDLKNGAYTFEQQKGDFKIHKLKYVFSIIGVCLFIGISIWLLVFKPWSDQVVFQEKETASSYTDFTVEERKHIDSLLKINQPEPTIILESSESYIEGRELMVDARKDVKNIKVNSFYRVWEEYLELDSVRSEVECKKNTKKNLIPEGFSNLLSKKSGKPTFFRNESKFLVQVIVYNNRTQGDAYYYELKTDEQIEFNFQIGEHIAIIAGNYPVNFKSEIESVVFCQFSDVTYNSLLTTYVLKHTNSYNYKFLVSGEDIYDFQLVDMYGVLVNY